jgi:hypothetical protein
MHVPNAKWLMDQVSEWLLFNFVIVNKPTPTYD